MTKIAIDPETGCWNWTAAIHPNGYGCFGHGRRADGKMGMVLAHRFSHEQFIGPIPEGLEVDHLCRNRSCVNPEHLEAVTRKVNTLRSEAPSAVAARRTCCASGHAYTEENTLVSPKGWRRCRQCNRETARTASRRYHARRRAISRGQPVPSWAVKQR